MQISWHTGDEGLQVEAHTCSVWANAECLFTCILCSIYVITHKTQTNLAPANNNCQSLSRLSQSWPSRALEAGDRKEAVSTHSVFLLSHVYPSDQLLSESDS